MGGGGFYDGAQMKPAIDAQIEEALQSFTQLKLAILFGSIASGRQRQDSDLDIAVASQQPLTEQEKIEMIGALAACTGRPVDLVDLKVAAEPLLGQILRHGRRIMGSDTQYGELISRHLFEQADFMPYRTRLLAERRLAWTGK